MCLYIWRWRIPRNRWRKQRKRKLIQRRRWRIQARRPRVIQRWRQWKSKRRRRTPRRSRIKISVSERPKEQGSVLSNVEAKSLIFFGLLTVWLSYFMEVPAACALSDSSCRNSESFTDTDLLENIMELFWKFQVKISFKILLESTSSIIPHSWDC